MRAIVTGPGRGGTNILRAYLEATEYFNFTDEIEDRQILEKKTLPERYATKLATENIKNSDIGKLISLMEKYTDLNLFFSIRNPFDCIMSKMRRGVEKSKGGDNTTETRAKDSSLEGATKAYLYSFYLLRLLNNMYSGRVHVFILANALLKQENTKETINNILNEHFEYKNLEQLNRNKYHRKRYGTKFKKEIVNAAYGKNCFDGYFKNKYDKITKEIYYSTLEVINLYFPNLRNVR